MCFLSSQLKLGLSYKLALSRLIVNILTLFGPAYFGISGTGGVHIVPPLSILGLGGVRVPILFGNDLPMND